MAVQFPYLIFDSLFAIHDQNILDAKRADYLISYVNLFGKLFCGNAHSKIYTVDFGYMEMAKSEKDVLSEMKWLISPIYQKFLKF